MLPKYKFELVTMNSLVYSADDIESVVMPAELGYLGVLAGHIPYITKLKEGNIFIKKDANNDKNDAEWKISGGFAKILPKQVVIFADKILEEKINNS